MIKTILIIFGPPASGKGTQANLLAHKFRLPVIATGAIFREEIKRRTILGGKIKNYVALGKLVPEKLVYSVFDKRLSKKDTRKGFILDGFPRNKKQLDYLIKKNKKIGGGKGNVWAILVEVSDKEVIKRVAGRRICGCGATYHLKFNPPREKNICDVCGSKLYIRNDDQPKVMRKRLKLYHKEMVSLLNYWGKNNQLITINGEQSIQKIHQNIIKELQKKFKNRRYYGDR